MGKKLVTYLLQNKRCDLPGIGTLILNETSAETDFPNGRILPPSLKIEFKPDEKIIFFNNDLMEDFAAIKNQLYAQRSASLSGIGSFWLNETDTIGFTPQQLPEAFLPPVTFERVIRQGELHEIQVGDTKKEVVIETKEKEEQPKQKEYWWIFAVLLALTAIGMISFFLYKNNLFTNFFEK